MTQQTLISPLPIKKAGESQFFKMLIYGASGVGKTRFLASLEDCPEMYPALILDVEKGTASISGSSVDTVEIDTENELQKMYAFLAKDTMYKTVAIDSLSQVYQMFLLDILKEANASGRRKDYMIDALEQSDYSKAMNKLVGVIRAFKMLDKHIIFTALLKEEIDAKEGLIRKPSFAGQLSESVGQFVDCLTWFMVNPDGTRVAVTQAQKGVRAKFRVPVGYTAPVSVHNPTASKMLAVKNGTYKG